MNINQYAMERGWYFSAIPRGEFFMFTCVKTSAKFQVPRDDVPILMVQEKLFPYVNTLTESEINGH